MEHIGISKVRKASREDVRGLRPILPLWRWAVHYVNSEAITEAIRAIRRARSAHGTGTRSRRMQTINPAHNRI